jgi:hypothetical protein
MSVIFFTLAARFLGVSDAHGQYIDTFFPPMVPGFNQQDGVTVLSRLRPLYQQQGVQLGSFLANGSVDDRVGYDSNVTGLSHGVGAGLNQLSVAGSAVSDWERDRLGVATSVENHSYFGEPQLDYTDYSASIGGGLTIGEHDLDVGYSHFHFHQLGTDIGAVATTTPVSYDVDAVRSNYQFDVGRFSFVPNIDFRAYQFGSAVIQGQSSNHDYRNRTVLSGGVTTKFALSDQRAILVVIQGSSSDYVHSQVGQPSNDSKSLLMLAGLDYQATGPLRYRLLGGWEVREFDASQFGTSATPVVAASVIWTPTGLTTVTGTVRREILDPQSEQPAGYTYTTLRLVVDHELKLNVLLQGRGSFQSASYLQGGGSTTSYSLGAGVTWLLNQRVRLSADYDFTQQTGPSNAAGTAGLNALTAGNYSRNIMLVGLHFAL